MGGVGSQAARARGETNGKSHLRPGHDHTDRGGCGGRRDGRHRGTADAGTRERLAGSAREDGARHPRRARLQRHAAEEGRGRRRAPENRFGGIRGAPRRGCSVHRGGCAEVLRAVLPDPHRRRDARGEGGGGGVSQAGTQRAGDVLRVLQGGDGIGDVANFRRFQHSRRARGCRGRREKRARARHGRHVPSNARRPREPRCPGVAQVPGPHRASVGQASSRREGRRRLGRGEGWRVQGHGGRRARARVRERGGEVARVPRGWPAEG